MKNKQINKRAQEEILKYLERRIPQLKENINKKEYDRITDILKGNLEELEYIAKIIRLGED